MNKIAKDFADLPINGALLNELRVEPLKQISLRFFTMPRHANRWEDNAGKDYGLHLTKVAAFVLDLSISPGAKLMSYAMVDDSELLKTIKDSSIDHTAKIDRDRIHHFQLIYDTGQIDIVAESFYCMLMSEV